MEKEKYRIDKVLKEIHEWDVDLGCYVFAAKYVTIGAKHCDSRKKVIEKLEAHELLAMHNEDAKKFS